MTLNVSGAKKKDFKNKDNKSNVPLCVFCNMRGHTEAQCRGKNRPCDICQQMGHHRNHCPNKSSSKAVTAQGSEISGDQNEFSLMVNVSDSEINLSEVTTSKLANVDLSDYIISDSGCTHTCTSHPHFIENIHQTNPHINIVMANGKKEPIASVECTGILN